MEECGANQAIRCHCGFLKIDTRLDPDAECVGGRHNFTDQVSPVTGSSAELSCACLTSRGTVLPSIFYCSESLSCFLKWEELCIGMCGMEILQNQTSLCFLSSSCPVLSSSCPLLSSSCPVLSIKIPLQNSGNWSKGQQRQDQLQESS